MTPNPTEIADYESQAREFIAKSRDYLSQGDLHQASEKGWGAAAHMAKAVAVAQGWTYDSHADFSTVLYEARRLTGNASLEIWPESGVRGPGAILGVNKRSEG